MILFQAQAFWTHAGGFGRSGGELGGGHTKVGASAVVGQAAVGVLRLAERVVHVHRHRHLLLNKARKKNVAFDNYASVSVQAGRTRFPISMILRNAYDRSVPRRSYSFILDEHKA